MRRARWLAVIALVSLLVIGGLLYLLSPIDFTPPPPWRKIEPSDSIRRNIDTGLQQLSRDVARTYSLTQMWRCPRADCGFEGRYTLVTQHEPTSGQCSFESTHGARIIALLEAAPLRPTTSDAIWQAMRLECLSGGRHFVLQTSLPHDDEAKLLKDLLRPVDRALGRAWVSQR